MKIKKIALALLVLTGAALQVASVNARYYWRGGGCSRCARSCDMCGDRYYDNGYWY